MSYETISLAFDGFSIGRFIEGRCGDVDLLDDLKPVGEYSPKKVSLDKSERQRQDMDVFY
jgi:hypothetical protein